MTDHNDESGIARVLAAAGARPQPPLPLQEAVRAATHTEWRAVLAARARRRKVAFALAAGIILAAGAFWARRPLVEAQGEETATDAGHYTNLDLPGGISVRLDHSTRIARLNPQHMILRAGAVYVDAGPMPRAAPTRLQIDTPAGPVSHLGTQYEVRLLPQGTRIRVREGRVELGGAVAVILQPSEQLLVAASGLLTRSRIAADSPEWDWAANAAPAFAIEGRSLAEFLTWAGRELGCEIVYSTPEAQAEATRAKLSGSIAGLMPGAALAAVLPTTRLRSEREPGRIVVQLQ